MKIKIKYVAKWFILLFPLILLFIYLIKNNFQNINENLDFFSYLYNFCQSNPISMGFMQIITILIPTGAYSYFEMTLLACFTWFLQVWIFWEFCELISKFYHKITNQEEE